MKPDGKLEVVLAREDADMLCDWIRARWAVEPVCVERPRQAHAVVTIYFSSLEEAGARQQELPDEFFCSSVQVLPCREEDWMTFWQHHFQVQEIGQRLRTVPAWEDIPDRKRINIRIDPGLSFGTGDHFTTRFCLEELERACIRFRPGSMLDAGTGSGILAIAAAKLGVPRVEAFDHDPACLARCEKNAALNQLESGRIRFFTANVLQDSGWCRPADVVCANILTQVLMAAAPALWQATRKRLILTGIREAEGDSVAEAFLPGGAREILRDGDGEWCGMVLDRFAE